MSPFDRAALRLKQELGVKTDKAASEALGLSQVAWVGRKKRNNFPETELLAMKARRQDFDVDVGYVLTGRRSSGAVRAHIDRMAAVTSPDDEHQLGLTTGAVKDVLRVEEQRAPTYAGLIEKLRYCTDEQVEALDRLIDVFGASSPRRVSSSPSGKPGTTGATQTFHGEVGNVMHGDVQSLTQHVGSKRSRKT